MWLFRCGGPNQQHEIFEGVDEIYAVLAEPVDLLPVFGREVQGVPPGGAGGDVDGDGFEGPDDGVIGISRVRDCNICA